MIDWSVPLIHGLIPAHAGKTSRRLSSRSPATAHPRSRGENGYFSLISSASAGSSPLTRGKHRRPEGHVCGRRLIPAHAGKTPSSPMTPGAMPAHPRSRGENFSHVIRMSPSAGSSPLTRGKLAVDRRNSHRGGLIPAHAGKTTLTRQRPWRSWAHPRSRGENSDRLLMMYTRAGSSPLTRGKRSYSCEGLLAPGLIPAHAGKTLGRRPTTPARRAHPRSRGENTPEDRARLRIQGSSPLTRGKPRIARVARLPGGLIPAHAGKTQELAAERAAITAHPRSRGENA